MNTLTIEKRNANFKTNKFENLKSREDFRLSLRKEKLHKYFMDKRTFIISDLNLNLEIQPDLLSIPNYIIDSLSMVSSSESQKSTLLNCLKSEQEELIKFAIYHLRKRLEMENTFNHELIDEEIIKALLFYVDTSQVQSIIYEALWCLINISFSNYDFCSKVFTSSYIINVLEKKIVEYLSDQSNEQILSSVIWLLGHITLDYKDVALFLINNMTVINNLHNIILRDNKDVEIMMKNISWFIVNCFLMVDQFKTNYTENFIEKISDILIIFSKNKCTDLRIDAYLGLHLLIRNTNSDKLREKILDENVINQIICIKYDNAVKLLSPCIKLLGDMLAGNDHIISRMIEVNVIPFLKVHLNEKNPKIKKDICWAFSNISCIKVFLEMLLREGVFEQLILIAKNDLDSLVKREALWAIANGCFFADVPMINLVVKHGVINIIIKYLERVKLDCDVVKILSEALMKIFEIGYVISKQGENKYITEFIVLGGKDTLEKKMSEFMMNEKIYRLLYSINDKYVKSNEYYEDKIY